MKFFQRFLKPSIPEEFAWYAKACQASAWAKVALHEARFVVLDTETTGLDTKKDRILSIGAVAVSNFTICVEDSFETVLQQDLYNAESIAVHEIMPRESATANTPKVVMEQFLKYVGNAVIIGHYVDFDFKMLNEACKRNLGFELQNPTYDTMQLLKRTDTHFAESNLHKAADFNLDNVCQRFNIPISDRHTAMGDATATALLFARQLKKLEHRGVKSVKDLLRR